MVYGHADRLVDAVLGDDRHGFDLAHLFKEHKAGRHGPLCARRCTPGFAFRSLILHFVREGREGASIGAICVLGDRPTLSPYLRQLILNPLQGHAQAARSIHNPDFLETLRELAAMDGAFVVNRRGIVDSAGTYLDAPIGRGRLRPGLGARHAVVLAITTVTDATAIVISASSGTVSVYDGGETALKLEQAHMGS
jgi:DNA integrity scanning protein DisA with diadenylate cyclase activity